MKVPSILAPLFVVLLVLSFTMAVGLLLVQSSAQSVDTSLRLLELHTRVVARHHELSQQSLQEMRDAPTNATSSEASVPEAWHTVRPNSPSHNNIRVTVPTSSR